MVIMFIKNPNLIEEFLKETVRGHNKQVHMSKYLTLYYNPQGFHTIKETDYGVFVERDNLNW